MGKVKSAKESFALQIFLLQNLKEGITICIIISKFINLYAQNIGGNNDKKY